MAALLITALRTAALNHHASDLLCAGSLRATRPDPPRTPFVLRDVMAHSTRKAHTRDVAGGVTRERDVGSETDGRCPYYARLFFYFTAAFRQWRTLRVGADRQRRGMKK